MDSGLCKELSTALSNYRHAITRANDQEAKDDYSRLAAITEKLIAAMQAGDIEQVKLGVLGFSRQVSDAFLTQPPEFRLLAGKIDEVKRIVV